MGLSLSKRTLGLIGAGTALSLAGGLATKKFLGRRGKGLLAHRGRRSSVARLRARVQRLSLKIKERQLKRKLFKEEIRV